MAYTVMAVTCVEFYLFRLDCSPSGCCAELLVSIISKHGPWQGHKLEVGCHLTGVAQNKMHLLALPIKGVTNLSTCGLQLTPASQNISLRYVCQGSVVSTVTAYVVVTVVEKYVDMTRTEGQKAGICTSFVGV